MCEEKSVTVAESDGGPSPIKLEAYAFTLIVVESRHTDEETSNI